MKAEDYEKWKVSRKLGIFKYVLFHGVLTYGVAMVIAMAIANKPYDEGLYTTKMFSHVMTWLTSGIVFGIGVWFAMEYKYKKYLNSDSDQ